MSYTKKTWKNGDTITAADLNNIEEGTSANASAIGKIEQSLTTYVGADVPRKAAATITPGTANQTIAANQYLTGTQTIKGDANLIAGNIKKGASIFGVTGTLEAGSTGTDTSDATATAGDILNGKTAYVNGEKVTGTITIKGAQVYTPRATDQTILAGYYLKGNQTIEGDANLIADNIKKGVSIFGVSGTLETGSTGTDTSDATATAGDILYGETAYVRGEKVTGTIQSIGARTITPSVNDKEIHAGYYLKGSQTIKGDSNLVAENIKSGVSIFGVIGTLETGSAGKTVKTGSFTGAGTEAVIETGLSSISAFMVYDEANRLHAAGLVCAFVDVEGGITGRGIGCTSYSQYVKNVSVSENGILTRAGGTITILAQSAGYKPISNATYKWYAVGDA